MKKNIVDTINIIARCISIIILLLFLVFFIGENSISDLKIFKTEEIILLCLIPVLLTIGTVIAWKIPLIGGIIISSSVIIFNIIENINSESITLNFFTIFALGILFIIVGINKKRRKE